MGTFTDTNVQVAVGLNSESFNTNSGSTATQNAGIIFAENLATSSLSDGQIASAIGVGLQTITLIRQGIPHWSFDKRVIRSFCKIYGFDPNLINANLVNIQRKILRLNRKQNWGVAKGFTGLGSKPAVIQPVPYIYAWQKGAPMTSAPSVSTPLTVSSIDITQAWQTYISTIGGRVYVSLDGRQASPSAYDYIIGTNDSTLRVWKTYCPPGQVSVCRLDSGANYMYAFENVGPSWSG